MITLKAFFLGIYCNLIETPQTKKKNDMLSQPKLILLKKKFNLTKYNLESALTSYNGSYTSLKKQ